MTLIERFPFHANPQLKEFPKVMFLTKIKVCAETPNRSKVITLRYRKKFPKSRKREALLSIKPQMLLLPLLLMNFMVRLTVSKPKLSGILPMKDCIYLWKIVKMALSW